jgi:MoaA/NifB/PqqE/SkfB family radical SAM enzyme
MSYRRISYAVWEITLKCNLACQHCGSRAGHARSEELTTAEALNLVQQLADVGIQEVTLIGGEAFLRDDWLEIASAITKAGMVCGMTTGGYGITLETARRMKEAGIKVVSVSVDGLQDTHNRLRGKSESWQWAFKTMGHLKEAGLSFGCNTHKSMSGLRKLGFSHGKFSLLCQWEMRLIIMRFYYNPMSCLMYIQ